MKYEVFFKMAPNGRAHEFVDLSDEYKRVGEVIADSRRQLEHLVATTNVIGEPRRIQVGDVIRLADDHNQVWIYTPMGAWAQVKTVR